MNIDRKKIKKGRNHKIRNMERKFLILLLVGLCLLVTGQLVWAEKWEPYQFKGSERYEYKLQSEEEEKREIAFILDIKESDKESFKVTYITQGILNKDELGAETAFGLWGAYGISLNILIVNPAYAFFFSQIDLQVGEKMNFFGAGIVKVIGKEKIAGREGFICQLSQADEEGKMMAEWIIDPNLALPLKSRIFDDGQLQGQSELTKYMEY